MNGFLWKKCKEKNMLLPGWDQMKKRSKEPGTGECGVVGLQIL